jgi:hypothetical protein
VQDSHHNDNQALASHAKKGRRKRRSFNKAFNDKKTSAAPGHEQRKDISRIQCFRCDKYGHIAINCPTRKKGRRHASTVDVDSEPTQRDQDVKDEAFFFISTLSDLVVLDLERYTVKGVGSSSFQLDSDIPLQLSEMLYVPGMKRNHVSVSALKDKGYKVIFSEGKFLAWHKNSRMDSTRVIGVRENNLYRLTVRPV